MNYLPKMDRAAQWNKRKQKYNFTRKKMAVLENYFFSGEMTEDIGLGLAEYLFYYPKQTTEGWQTVLDEVYIYSWKEWNKHDESAALDKFFEEIQRAFLGLISNYCFEDEDRAWIFRQVFGDQYDPEWEFPLILPTENRKRKITKSPDWILGSLLYGFYRYFEEDEECPYSIHLMDYIESLLLHVSRETYDTVEPGEDSDSVRAFYAVNKMIEYAAMVDTGEDQLLSKKIALAKKLKSVFDPHADKLGNYRKLVETVERDGSLI